MNVKSPMDDIRIEYEIIWTQSQRVSDGLYIGGKIEYCNPNLPYNHSGQYYAVDCLNHTRYDNLHDAMYSFINMAYSQDKSCPVLYTQMETKVIVNNKEFDFSDRAMKDKQDGNYTFYNTASIPNLDNKQTEKLKYMLSDAENEMECFKLFMKKYNVEKMYNDFKEEYKKDKSKSA